MSASTFNFTAETTQADVDSKVNYDGTWLGGAITIEDNAQMVIGSNGVQFSTVTGSKAGVTFNAKYSFGLDAAFVVADNGPTGYASAPQIITVDNVTFNGKERGIYGTANGDLTINAREVKVTSVEHGISLHGGSKVTVNNAEKFTVTADTAHGIRVMDGGDFTFNAAKSGAEFVVNGGSDAGRYGIVVADNSTLAINNKNGTTAITGGMNVEGTLSLNSNTDVKGKVNNEGSIELTGKTVFNDQVTNAGVISIGQGVTFFKGGLVSGTPSHALFASRATTGINLNGGTLVLEGTGNYINTLTGEGALQLNTLGFEIGNNQVNALNVTVSGEINEAINGNYSEILEKFNTENAQGKQIAQLTLTEGNSTNGAVITFNEQGEPVVHVTANTTMTDMLEMGAATANAVTRTLQNDVRKRLGDLRSAEAQSGAWVRYDGGRMSGQHTATKFNTLQMGYDTVAFRDDVRVGASLSYTRGDTELRRGSADVDTYSFAMYGTWMADNGMFADVIARVASVKNDMTFAGDKTGKLDNTAYAISGEFGQRFDVAKNFFVEPQIEVSYTYIDSDDVRLTGVSSAYKFDSVESLIGRAGMVAGWTCPNQKGHVYARASVLREFMGDSEVSAGSNRIERDGQDTWAEIGLGAQYNINKNAYVWADVERTQGADINEDFRGTVGVRFNF